MNSDYVDNWDGLPEAVQDELTPIISLFDTGADQLFDRRLNLSFEAAVRELSIPGIVALTSGLRELQTLLTKHVTITDAGQGALQFDNTWEITAYDLPLYTPCLYLSQVAQFQETENVRVWKESTAEEIIGIVLTMARYIRPDIEMARIAVGAVHDLVMLYPNTLAQVREAAGSETFPNSREIAHIALGLLKHRLPK